MESHSCARRETVTIDPDSPARVEQGIVNEGVVEETAGLIVGDCVLVENTKGSILPKLTSRCRPGSPPDEFSGTSS